MGQKSDMAQRLKIHITVAISAVISLLVLGTVVYHYLEKWTWIQAFYFSVVSLGTVGYGDLVPSTDISRLFTALYILVGVAVFLTALGTIGTSYLKLRERRILRRRTHEKK